MPERGTTMNRANSNPQQTFAGRHGSCKRPRRSYSTCVKVAFLSNTMAEKQATVGWKSDGYVGFARIELVPNNHQISLLKKG